MLISYKLTNTQPHNLTGLQMPLHKLPLMRATRFLDPLPIGVVHLHPGRKCLGEGVVVLGVELGTEDAAVLRHERFVLAALGGCQLVELWGGGCYVVLVVLGQVQDVIFFGRERLEELVLGNNGRIEPNLFQPPISLPLDHLGPQQLGHKLMPITNPQYLQALTFPIGLRNIGSHLINFFVPIQDGESATWYDKSIKCK